MPTLAETFFQTVSSGIGANILMFGIAIIVLTGLFIVTRQSLASSLLLGIVMLDGLDRVANEPFISLLYLIVKILMGAVIGIVFIITIFKK